jgi:hypothetical protein
MNELRVLKEFVFWCLAKLSRTPRAFGRKLLETHHDIRESLNSSEAPMVLAGALILDMVVTLASALTASAHYGMVEVTRSQLAPWAFGPSIIMLAYFGICWINTLFLQFLEERQEIIDELKKPY